MADIRIKDLPEEISPVAGEAVAIDGSTTRRTTIEKLVAAGRPLASQAEAEAGTQATKAMTPLTTAQAIAAQVSIQAAITDLEIIGGDENDIIVAVPPGFREDRLYSISPSVSNTGPVTIHVDGYGTYPVTYANGDPVAAGELSDRHSAILVFRSGRFDVLVGSSPQDAIKDFLEAINPYFAVKLQTTTTAGQTDYPLSTPVPGANGHLHVNVRVGNAAQPKDGIAYTIINDGATIHLSEDPGDDQDLYVEGAAVYGATIVPDLPPVSADSFLVDNADGTARETKSFPDVRDLLGIDRPKHARKNKLLLTADWQCIPEVTAQLAAERAMMDDIQTHHSDADWALFLGDLVDRPTENSTGVPSPRGYKELFADMRSRIWDIPLSRWLFLSGNHDRDGTGVGAWKDAWTLKSYRSEVGPLWYHVDYGNLRMIFMGDMSGSLTGEVLDVAIDWFRLVMERSKNYNVVVCMHQPPDPTVYPPSADPLGGAFQRNPARITDIINANDNVVLCLYGHVGSNINDATLVTTAYGATWMNLQMGIPTAFNNGFDLHYALAEFEQGDTEILVRRWNATTHNWLGLNDATIALKFPAQLSGDHLDFDGRRQTDPQVPISYGPVVSYQSASDFRGDGPFGVAEDMLIAHKIIVGDDAGNNLTSQGVATGYYVPGASDTATDSGGNQVYSQPAYGLGGLIGFRRQSNDDTDYGAAFEVWCKSVGTGTFDKIIDARPLSSAIAGVAVTTGCGFSVNGTYSIDPNGHFRLRTYSKTELLALSSSPVGMLVRCSDGDGGNPCVAISLGGSLGWSKIAIGAVIS